MPGHVVIVDPLSTGRELAPAFAARGVKAVAVLSMRDLPPVYAPHWQPENFAAAYTWDGDPGSVATLADELRAYDPICVIPGAESGVELADLLCEAVLPGTGNPVESSACRRDKWLMAEALARAALPVLRQLRTADIEEAAAWIEANGLAGERLVLKPPKSAGTDEVHIVEPGDDWRAAFTRILGRINAVNLRNDAVLVQEFADGTEYIVDLYSVDGRHGLVDVCRYTKSRRDDRIGIYDRVDFLARDEPEIDELFAFARAVADAVGIRTGCGHAEVMLTAKGPRLLEIGARPAGGGHQLVTRLATGDCHIDRTVRHHLDGGFTPDFTLVQHVRAAFLAVHETGVWRNGDVFDPVDDLTTYHSKNIPFGTGDVVPATTGLFDAFGWVVLAHPDENVLHADYLTIKELEQRVRIDPALTVHSGGAVA